MKKYITVLYEEYKRLKTIDEGHQDTADSADQGEPLPPPPKEPEGREMEVVEKEVESQKQAPLRAEQQELIKRPPTHEQLRPGESTPSQHPTVLPPPGEPEKKKKKRKLQVESSGGGGGGGGGSKTNEEVDGLVENQTGRPLPKKSKGTQHIRHNPRPSRRPRTDWKTAWTQGWKKGGDK